MSNSDFLHCLGHCCWRRCRKIHDSSQVWSWNYFWGYCCCSCWLWLCLLWSLQCSSIPQISCWIWGPYWNQCCNHWMFEFLFPLLLNLLFVTVIILVAPVALVNLPFCHLLGPQLPTPLSPKVNLTWRQVLSNPNFLQTCPDLALIDLHGAMSNGSIVIRAIKET